VENSSSFPQTHSTTATIYAYVHKEKEEEEEDISNGLNQRTFLSGLDIKWVACGSV
jgi:hypothetical protein